VHLTGGSLRVFKLFAQLQADSVTMALSCPTHQQVTQAVGQQGQNQGRSSDSMKKDQELPSSTIALLAKKTNGSVRGQDYVDWAVQALTENFDSPSLSILASLDLENDFSLWEAEKFFKKVVCELDWSFPDNEAILRTHLATLIIDIQNGTVDPEKWIERIHQEVVSPLGHPSDLQGWCFLWEGNDPVEYRILSKEEYSSRIIDFAKAWTTEKS
jgi:hypothetical protein